MPRFKYGKMVRDKIVNIQIASGARPQYRTLGNAEHRRELIGKIAEEAHEIATARSDEIAGEIADVQQAIDDLITKCGLTKDDIREAQLTKAAKNGAFSKGLFIDYVDIQPDDPWLAYYEKNADRYPRLD